MSDDNQKTKKIISGLNPSINDIKIMKRNTEKQINVLIESFQELSGLSVSGLVLDLHSKFYCDGSPIADVHLEVKI